MFRSSNARKSTQRSTLFFKVTVLLVIIYLKALGLTSSKIAGRSVKDAISEIIIDRIIKNPKNLTGINTENNKTEKPIVTDKPLNKIPLPTVRLVFKIELS